MSDGDTLQLAQQFEIEGLVKSGELKSVNGVCMQSDLI